MYLLQPSAGPLSAIAASASPPKRPSLRRLKQVPPGQERCSQLPCTLPAPGTEGTAEASAAGCGLKVGS